jgi:MFS transporter, OPA family, glycerol-3-phosphate transporter
MMPTWLENILPILVLLTVCGVVIGRLPKVEGVDHALAFKRRRVLNWLPLGLTYAFLYMGRYNLTVSKGAFEDMQDASGGALMGNDDFAFIFLVGTWVYGISFLINGPLTDRFGGKKAILLGALGAAVANLMMGAATWQIVEKGAFAAVMEEHFVLVFSVLYGLNMYFQSFGAVAIVKVNAPWFHLRERGVFGAIFGILISLGIYFAYDGGKAILANFGLVEVFVVPAVLLLVFWVVDGFLVHNTPGEAGQKDFDVADASSGDDGPQLGVVEVFRRMVTNPVIMTIAVIEFCSGFLRQAIMQWYRTFAKQTNGTLGYASGFVYDNWGLMLCCAGILGGVLAGVISDHLFQARRGPVAFFLYATMLVGSVLLFFLFETPVVGVLAVLLSTCVIGVHGMLSGTASMDFGGKKNVGVAVGLIDGFVYLGTGVMSLTYGLLLPKEQFDAAGKLVGPATDPKMWAAWPGAMIPLALLGTVLALRLWNARPAGKAKAAH